MEVASQFRFQEFIGAADIKSAHPAFRSRHEYPAVGRIDDRVGYRSAFSMGTELCAMNLDLRHIADLVFPNPESAPL